MNEKFAALKVFYKLRISLKKERKKEIDKKRKNSGGDFFSKFP